MNGVDEVLAEAESFAQAWGQAHYETALAGSLPASRPEVGVEDLAAARDRLKAFAVERLGEGRASFVGLAENILDAQTALGSAHRRADDRQSYQAGVAVGRAEKGLEVAEAALREGANLTRLAALGDQR